MTRQQISTYKTTIHLRDLLSVDYDDADVQVVLLDLFNGLTRLIEKYDLYNPEMKISCDGDDIDIYHVAYETDAQYQARLDIEAKRRNRDYAEYQRLKALFEPKIEDINSPC